MPGDANASNGEFFRTQRANNPWTKDAYSTFSPGQYTALSEYLYVEAESAADARNVFVDNRVVAGEHLSDEHYGFMNGAAQTGRFVANVVMALM